MALIVETGSGVVGAESYASVATADAHWSARAHTAFATTWAAATTANKEGALREATGYVESNWGSFYRGARRGYVQSLLWPRTGALDDAGYPLPDLPQEMVNAVCELAGRAISARLAPDAVRGGAVKRQKVEGIEREFFDGAPSETRFGAVSGMLAPILTGGQPDARGATWFWR